ncbi:hypothetical protein SARC_01458 [Sphaeroforma arctica JP610]|uniref:Aminotransferase class V domain-containing protein n=1 Tax=Sphaeroforma arctica JP610 TaxID=667725 RepID=A0A0L0GDR8_9EUKA|nr:hypothetical protein SARC_01458 [Sphaeroforma arctica JP610]KNC86408.1 hypothetical protein SARC_01458 [Sphaeroforma arctica JP610]|eukprot:XP_014160310.1 hypothetical protein SARC_01458 [Sphaeroforma arctica JP610]
MVNEERTQFECDDGNMILVASDGTAKADMLRTDCSAKSWLLVIDPEDLDDQEHPTLQRGAVETIKNLGFKFVNIALSERTYGHADVVQDIIETLDNLPRPTVIQCNTTRRAGSVLTLYHAFKDQLNYDEVQEYAIKNNLLYKDSPELVGWVNRNAPAAKPPPAFNIPEDIMKQRKAEFMEEHGSEYGYKNAIYNIRTKDFKRMGDQVYLDYTGSGQYRETQVGNCLLELQTTLFGNSHSHSPSSEATEHELNAARKHVLDHFNADEKEYSVVFTSGATGALKIVGECFPFTEKSTFAFLNVNHNSVVGIREYAHAKKATIKVMTDKEVERCLDQKCNHGAIPETPTEDPSSWDQLNLSDEHCGNAYMNEDRKTYNLFAYPPEDNFCGVKYPLDWIEKIEKVGMCGKRDWKVVLDAAAFVPTQKLDLGLHKPSFVDVSFYKMFGFPSGLGCLIARNDTLPLLQRSYFGGGTVILATIKKHFVQFARKRATRFEDGTLSFLSIAALKYGFAALRELGMDNIAAHTHTLSRHLYKRLSQLKHFNGQPVVQVFGKWETDNAEQDQGHIVTFSAYNYDSSPIGYHTIQMASAEAGFHVRTGAHCNPGGVDMYLKIGEDKVEKFARQKTSCGDDLDTAEGMHLGTVRVSCGTYSTFEDVERFCSWFEEVYVVQSEPVVDFKKIRKWKQLHALVDEVPDFQLNKLTSGSEAEN